MSADDKRLALEQVQKGAVLYRAGQLGLAQSHGQRAAKLDPANADAWRLLGVIALRAGNPVLAAKHLRTSIKFRPGFADAHNDLGVALREQGRPVDAIGAFRDALALRATYVDAMFNLAVTFEATDALDEADRAYRQTLVWRTIHVDAALHLGNLLRRRGNPAEALPLLEKAQRLARDGARTNGDLALLLIDLGRHAEAARFARAAALLEPEQAAWWKALGVAERLLHDVENAIASLRKALALDPRDATAALELGLALLEAGAVDEARTLFAGVPAPEGCGERVRWLRALALPAIYRDDAEIDATRVQFAAGLEQLRTGLDLDRPQSVHEALQAASSVAPFYLHYQPCDNTDLQGRFGDLVASVMARAVPELVENCTGHRAPMANACASASSATI